MSIHTPGPWTYIGSDTDKAILVKHQPGDGLVSHIARMYDAWICDEHGGTAGANACLIAAAPQLLEALKEFIGDDSADIHTARCATQPPWMRGCAEQGPCDCRYGRARAAIKLAEEGKAP